MPESRILMGVIGRPHGVRGWVRITVYTAEDLTAYGPLSDAKGRRFVLRSRAAGVAEVAELVEGAEVKLADRAAAEKLTNTRLYVERERLPEPEPDEFYLADLVGLAACDAAGAGFGTVTAVHDYGAGVSLEIGREGGAAVVGAVHPRGVPEVDVARGRWSWRRQRNSTPRTIFPSPWRRWVAERRSRCWRWSWAPALPPNSAPQGERGGSQHDCRRP